MDRLLRSRLAFSALLLALFLARGLYVIAILPPFEGWDEYQHLAYIVHLDETGERPHAETDLVSPALIERLREHPHPYYGFEQLVGTGARTYAAFWNEREAHLEEPPPEVRLYQGQHASAAYWLMWPVFAAAGGLEDLPKTVACLRILNLLLTAFGLGIALFAFSKRISDSRLFRLAALLALASPLLLMNACRVANDGLAFLLGTTAVAILLAGMGPSRAKRVVLLGVVLGLAVIAKSTNLPLAGGIMLAFFLTGLRRGEFGGHLLRTALLVLAFLLPLLPETLSNMQDYGSPLSDKRSVAAVEGEQGPGLEDYRAGLEKLPWLGSFRERILRLSLFTGGWSYARLPLFVHDIQVWIVLGASALTLISLLSRRNPLRRSKLFLPLASIFLIMLLGLAAHALMSFVGDGMAAPRSNPWYLAVGFPFLTLFLVLGTASLPRLLHASLALATALFYFGVEAWGQVFVLTRVTTAGAGPAESWSRLAAMSPSFLGPWVGAGAGLLAVTLFVVALRVVVRGLGASENRAESESIALAQVEVDRLEP